MSMSTGARHSSPEPSFRERCDPGSVFNRNEAIRRLKARLDQMPQTDARYEPLTRNLAEQCEDLYEITKQVGHLSGAITWYHEHLQLDNNRHDKAAELALLGGLHNHRFLRLGDEDDLKASLEYNQEAAELTPPEHPKYIARKETVAQAYGNQFQRHKIPEDNEKSIEIFGECLRAASNNIDSAYLSEQLGLAYTDKYYKLGKEPEDIMRALGFFQTAVNLTPEGGDDLPRRLYGLGSRIGTKCQLSKDARDLQASISTLKEAIRRTDDRDPYLAQRLAGLAAVYELGQLHFHLDYHAELREVCLRGLGHSDSAPLHRIRNGRNIFIRTAERTKDIATSAEQWKEAYEIARETLGIVPLFISQSLNRESRQYLVEEIAGLAIGGASAALNYGTSAYEALQMLEDGRAVVTGSTFDLRDDHSALRETHPMLAEEFERLRLLLDGPERSQSSDRHDVAIQFQKLKTKIRGMPGFAHYLSVPSEAEMKAAATNGSIAVIIPSSFNSYAMLVESDSIKACRLPDLDSEELLRKQDKLKEPDSSLLEWIWKTVTEPVLRQLRLTDAIKTESRRIWWIPTGPMTKFPLHAAGFHLKEGSYDTVLDRVVSSYSPSIKSLVRNQRLARQDRQSAEPRSMVLTAVELDLQHVNEEALKVKRVAESMGFQVRQPELQKDAILHDIADCTIFHFAGHGTIDPSDPQKNALILPREHLTMRSIERTNLQHRRPYLAYLSACDTGSSAPQRLADEGLHMVGACELAGFRHVIGTLWSVDDEASSDIAATFYAKLGQGQLSTSAASAALHQTYKVFRDKWAESEGVPRPQEQPVSPGDSRSKTSRNATMEDDVPLYWVPFIHSGP